MHRHIICCIVRPGGKYISRNSQRGVLEIIDQAVSCYDADTCCQGDCRAGVSLYKKK